MTSFTVNGEVTTSQTLGLAEAGAVTMTGNLMVTGAGNAVNMTDFAFLTVSGSIFAAQSAIDSLSAAFINVGATGVVTAFDSAIHVAGGSILSTVNNKGIIYGFSGIVADSGPLTVSNAGQITGDGSSAIVFAGTGLLSVANSGDVFGASFGIFSSGTTSANIVNSGIITGSSGAMSLGSGASNVLNTGTLGGRTLLGGGTDQFDGTGGVQGIVYGGAGADTIRGGAGDDVLNGDAGADVLRGNAGDDVMGGGADADVLYGGLGEDSLTGGTGLDTLRGGDGDDRLTGGTLADTFVFSRGQGTDRVTDFLNGTDKLDLRAFDFANLAAVKALASASSLGLRIDVPGEGILFVQGLTLATLTAGDVLL